MTELDGVQLPVNEYFLDHPDAVLGELRAVHGMHNAEDLVVAASGDTGAALARALTRVAEDAASRSLTWTPAGQSQAPSAPAGPRSQHPDGHLEAHRDGTFTQVADGHAIPFPVPASQGAELRQLLALRDAVTRLLDAEAASLDDTPELDRLRQDLNRRYDAYLQAYGPISRFSWRHTGRTDPATGEEKLARIRPPQGGFRSDPFAPLVQALEEFDPVSQTAAKAAIFTGRVVAPRNPRLGADNPADALAICLDVSGKPGWTRSPGCSAPARSRPARNWAPWSSTIPKPGAWSRPRSTCPAGSGTSSKRPNGPRQMIPATRSTPPNCARSSRPT